MIKLSDYWMGRNLSCVGELTTEIEDNAEVTVLRANSLLVRYQKETGDDSPRGVVSGWRPPSINAQTRGAAHRSNHMTGKAIDIEDPDGTLDNWCVNHLDVLRDLGLWLEHPSATIGWTHLQTCPPRSGARCFLP